VNTPYFLSIFYQFFWVVLMGLMTIGGYFMFRKFLKSLPKADGKSELDWQNHYIEKTIHLWDTDQKLLLNELVAPVPELFRDVAKQKIAGKIGEIALQHNAKKMTEAYIIEGYILATPKRDHKWLLKTLQKKNIDLKPYGHLLD
jgi:hypothetical protein